MPKLLSIDRTARVAGPALLVLRLKIALTNSPPRRGGVARSAGVVSSAKSRTCRSDHYYGFALSRSRFAPVCAAFGGSRHLIGGASSPPLRGGACGFAEP